MTDFLEALWDISMREKCILGDTTGPKRLYDNEKQIQLNCSLLLISMLCYSLILDLSLKNTHTCIDSMIATPYILQVFCLLHYSKLKLARCQEIRKEMMMYRSITGGLVRVESRSHGTIIPL